MAWISDSCVTESSKSLLFITCSLSSPKRLTRLPFPFRFEQGHGECHDELINLQVRIRVMAG